MQQFITRSPVKIRVYWKCVCIDLYLMTAQLQIVPITPFAIIIQNTSQSCSFVQMYEDVQITHANACSKYANKSWSLSSGWRVFMGGSRTGGFIAMTEMFNYSDIFLVFMGGGARDCTLDSFRGRIPGELYYYGSVFDLYICYYIINFKLLNPYIFK